MEIWNDIKGFEGFYQISNLGNVKSLDRYIESSNRWGTMAQYLIKGQTLKPRLANNYLYVKFNNKGKTCKKIHRLVAEAFIDNPLNLPQVNHKNGNKLDNRVENLEWTDAITNSDHAYEMGLAHSGSDNHYAKLNEKIVAEILYINKTTELTYSKIGELFNVCSESVSNMCRGKSWKRPHIREKINQHLTKLENKEENISVDISSIKVSARNWRRR